VLQRQHLATASAAFMPATARADISTANSVGTAAKAAVAEGCYIYMYVQYTEGYCLFSKMGLVYMFCTLSIR